MPILSLILFFVLAVIWIAVLLTVLSDGFGPGMHLWIQLFVLIGFPLAAYRTYLRIKSAKGELE
jgi:hypothetical protein